MKAALEEWLGCGGGRGVKGVLVGIRQGDPNDGQFITIYSARSLTKARSCGYNSTHRPFLAPVHPRPPYSSLDVLRCMELSP